jgi:hypothetical protein
VRILHYMLLTSLRMVLDCLSHEQLLVRYHKRCGLGVVACVCNHGNLTLNDFVKATIFVDIIAPIKSDKILSQLWKESLDTFTIFKSILLLRIFTNRQTI